MKFQAKKETEKIIEFIREYYKEHNLGGAILGISGGKDSAVVAALMCEAIGCENVVGLTLPCHSKKIDKSDAYIISEHYGFQMYDFDLTNVFDAFKKEFELIPIKGNTTNSDLNLKPRLRMASVYYFAAFLSEIFKKTYIVIGTSNKSELFVGYFTKGGDSVHDLAPIADLTVEEVIQVGEVLNVPEKILYKTPNDGLSNKTDEDKLGVTYQDISNFMEDKNSVDMETRKKIEKLHKNSLHKFYIPKYEKKE